MTEPQVLELSERVGITSDSSLPRGVSCAMKITTRSGASYETQVDYAKGSLENPMTDEEHRDKFCSLVSSILSKEKMAQVIDMVASLEEVNDISKLCRLLY